MNKSKPSVQPGNGNTIVLLYHRVIPDGVRSEGPIISLSKFREHLDFIEENFDIIKFKTVKELFKAETNSNKSKVVISFDDCLLDSLEITSAELTKRGHTAILFPLVQEFRDDYCNPIFLAQHLMAKIGWGRFKECLPNFRRVIQFSAVYISRSSSNYRMFSKWCQSLSITKLVELHHRINKIHGSHIPSRLFPNNQEVLSLQRKGFKLGSHTLHHPALSRSSPGQVEHEINTSYKALSKWVDKEGEFLFSYPFNSYTDKVLKMLEDNQFTAAFTTNPSAISANTNKFLIPRICADTFSKDDLFQLKQKLEA